jgi:hypothetical protein
MKGKRYTTEDKIRFSRAADRAERGGDTQLTMGRMAKMEAINDVV